MIQRRSSKFLLIFANAMSVAQLRIVLRRKYFGKRISWHNPNECRGSEKYKAKPDTNVIQSWAPKWAANDPKYTNDARALFVVSRLLCNSGQRQ